jgi:CheY-like chemotaxis protein
VSGDQAIRAVEAAAQLLGAVIWPAVLVFFLWHFREPIRKFIDRAGELSLTAGGVEATLRTQKAAVNVGLAEAQRAAEAGEPAEVTDPQVIAAALPTPQTQQRLLGARILWVDDHPDNNRYERQALEALGIIVDLATSTDEALEKLRRQQYKLVISDMGRPPDRRAGYTLLDAMRQGGNHTPFVIYAGSRAPEHGAEARRHGAVGSTNSPQELVTMVTGAITTQP